MGVYLVGISPYCYQHACPPPSKEGLIALAVLVLVLAITTTLVVRRRKR